MFMTVCLYEDLKRLKKNDDDNNNNKQKSSETMPATL